MIFKSIIVEDKPTVNFRVYKKGSLQKFKEYLQEQIDKKCCFVWLGNCIPDDTLNGVVGYVSTFKIENGQGLFDINLFDKTKQLVESMAPSLQIDFYLNAILSDDKDSNGNSYVDLSDFSIDGLRLLKVNDEGNN